MDEINHILIEVGKKFPLYKDSLKKLVGVDGSFFEAEELNQGYSFYVHLSDISFMESQAFRNDKISIRVLQGDHGMVLPIIKIGKSLSFEVSFDPTLYNDERAFQFVDTNNILTMYLIESNSGILKAIRQCNLPLKMIQICREAWGRAMLESNYSERFTEWYNRLMLHQPKALWGRATNVGVMGEVYDLQDIKIPNQYKPNV